MTTTTIGSGQVFTGTALPNDTVTVAAGGTASAATVDGGSLIVESGGTATGTQVGGVRLAPGNLVSTAYGGTYGAGSLLLSGGTASGTAVTAGGSEVVSGGGTDTGTTIGAGGTLQITAGTVAGAVVRKGAAVTAGSGTTLDHATLEAFAGLTLRAGANATALALAPGSFVDLPDLAFVPGGSVSLDAASNRLTVIGGASTVTLPLAGSLAGLRFALGSEFTGTNPDAVPGTVLLVTDSSGANAAFGFDHIGSGLLAGNGVEPDGPPPQDGRPIAFNSTIVTTDAAETSALGIATTAYLAIANAGAGGPLPGVYATSLDGAGDQATYSTIDNGTGHVIAATGTGRSVIAAGSGHDTVTVRNGADQVVTGLGTNTIYLESGNNTLISEGTDVIEAGAGSDTIAISGRAVAFNARAHLDIALADGARLTLHTGAGSVTVAGGFGGGTFSGGTNGGNVLVAGTAATTLYAGGDGDALFGSGGIGTTMNGWGGNETMNGRYGAGTQLFNFNAANVTASSGTGQNTFNVGAGNNVIDTSFGTSVIDLTNGQAGGSTYLGGFAASAANRVHLAGYAADEVSHALGTATYYAGSEILHLRDGSTITFGGVTGLTSSSFV